MILPNIGIISFVYKKYPKRNIKKEGTAVSRMINFFPGFNTRLISRNP